MIPNFHKKILSLCIAQTLHQIGFERFSVSALQTFTDSVIYFLEKFLKEINSRELIDGKSGTEDNNFKIKYNIDDIKDDKKNAIDDKEQVNFSDFNLKLICQPIINWGDLSNFIKSQVEIKELLVKKTGRDSSMMSLIKMLPDKISYEKKGVAFLSMPEVEKQVKVCGAINDFINKVSKRDYGSEHNKIIGNYNEDRKNNHDNADAAYNFDNKKYNDYFYGGQLYEKLSDDDFLNIRWVDMANKRKKYFFPAEKNIFIYSDNYKSPYNILLVDEFVDKGFFVDKERKIFRQIEE